MRPLKRSTMPLVYGRFGLMRWCAILHHPSDWKWWEAETRFSLPELIPRQEGIGSASGYVPGIIAASAS